VPVLLPLVVDMVETLTHLCGVSITVFCLHVLHPGSSIVWKRTKIIRSSISPPGSFINHYGSMFGMHAALWGMTNHGYGGRKACSWRYKPSKDSDSSTKHPSIPASTALPNSIYLP
jgi:hypothetical protein